MKKVFLGGTCNESKWRDRLISMLKIDYFNPVVEDWTEECRAEERRQRELCDFCLYVITPRMSGVYSIAEAVDDSNKRPKNAIFCVLSTDEGWYQTSESSKPSRICFNDGQLKSLKQVGEMVQRNGGKYFANLEDVASYLNTYRKTSPSLKNKPWSGLHERLASEKK